MRTPDPFTRLIPESLAFLKDLRQNNTRDWFTAQKSRYEAELKTPATLLLDQVAADLQKGWGRHVTTKLFRPHRDVRFSKDKTPYHTHLHMLWTLDDGASPGFFFGVSPEYVRAGAGLMAFDKAALIRWRAAIDGPAGDTITAVLAAAEKDGLTPDAPDLKRVPAPFPQDHRHGDLLRRKGLAIWADLPEASQAQPTDALRTQFSAARPVIEALEDCL